ncbi:ice-binding family protein [Sphaerisporangium sp. NPDC005289]|uniref:ice-binding family protein n=1 Tax=Sphaerisporangium sp. NPDC005289 TaxID=3155247 RepID=UPI0033A41294
MGAVIATPHAASAATAPVPLGPAAAFGLLAGTSVHNTGPSLVTGNLGVSPGAAVTGFPPGRVIGVTHTGDPIAALAQTALSTAYNDAAGRVATATVPPQLGGTTRGPGVYDSTGGSFAITGNLTLDAHGDPNAVFIFRTSGPGSLNALPGSTVTLTGGARACNVFWRVVGRTIIGAGAVLDGTVLAGAGVDIGTRAIVNGRVLARTGAGVALNDARIRRPICGGRTTVTLTTSCSDPGHRGPLSLTATVRTNGTTPPTGQVVFLADGISRGAAPLDATGQAVLVPPALEEGPHSITALFPGSASFDSSLSATIHQDLGPGGACPEVCVEKVEKKEEDDSAAKGRHEVRADDRKVDDRARNIRHHHNRNDDRLVEFANVRTITGVLGEGGGHRHHSRSDRHRGHQGGHQGGQAHGGHRHQGHGQAHARSQARSQAQAQARQRPALGVTG